MTNGKRACPSVPAPGQAAEMGTTCRESTFSSTNFITFPPLGQAVKIADFLGHGQAAAVPLRHLKELTGLDGRTIRLMIEQERRSGVPLLSDNKHGYFMAADTQERDCFVRSMRGRAHEIIKVAEAVEKAKIGGE